MTKRLYIISGPNGAGKTTASLEILPELIKCEEFVNADEIARGISPFNPESVAIEAGRIQLERIKMLINKGADFSIETTLATKSYKNLIRHAQLEGYDVELLFFWLPSPDAAIERVKKRVSEGGHNIPHDTIVRRYRNGLKNLFNIYIPIVNSWSIINNFEVGSQYIATGQCGCVKIFNNDLFYKIKDYAEGSDNV